MKHSISLGLAMVLLWVLLSGIWEGWLLALGLVSVAITVFIAHRMDVIDHEGHPVALGPGAVTYWPWLFWEIAKSNWQVATILVRPDMPISPRVLSFKTSQKTELGNVVLANSVTLTPGTVSLQLEDGILTAHAFTGEIADALAAGDMDRRVTAMEAKGK